jgi:lipoprotein NlpI
MYSKKLASALQDSVLTAELSDMIQATTVDDEKMEELMDERGIKTSDSVCV